MRVLALLGAANAVSAQSQIEGGSNPIRQVVTILEDMVKQLTAEQENDDGVHAKLTCWCKKNNDEQTQIREKSIVAYGAAIAGGEKAFASKEALQEKRDERYAKKRDATDSLNETKARCAKDKRDYNKNDINLDETVKAATNAVMILTRGQSFVQADVSQAKKLLQKIVSSAAAKALQRPEAMIVLQGFLDDESLSSSNTAFLQQPGGFQAFKSQAGPVVGMLKAMITDLTNDRESNAKEEEARRQGCVDSIMNFNQDITALAKQIEADDKQIGEYAEEQARQQETAQQADTDRLNAIAFLDSLTQQCGQSKADYVSRRDSRAAEIKACNETIQILDSDEAFASFQNNSVTATNFFQVDKRVKKGEDARIMAVWAIDKVAQKNASIYLIQSMIQSAISSKAKGGVFDQIITKIDEVVKVIRADLQEQIRMRDQCTEDIATLEMNFTETTKDKEYEKAQSEAAQAEIESLTVEINERQEQVASLDNEVAEKGEDRKAENAVFVESKKDAQTTIDILKAAITKMVEVYGKKPGSFLEQPGADVTAVSATASAPGSAPAGFTNQGQTTKKQGDGNEVLHLLRTIQEDAEKELSTIVESESDAENAYDEAMRQATNEKNGALKAIASGEKRRATAEGNKQSADENADSLSQEARDLLAQLDSTKSECNEVLTHFKQMQVRGKDEIESLKQAKTVLSGLNN